MFKYSQGFFQDNSDVFQLMFDHTCLTYRESIQEELKRGTVREVQLKLLLTSLWTVVSSND